MDLVSWFAAVPDVNKTRYGTRVDSAAGLTCRSPFTAKGCSLGCNRGFDYTHPMFLTRPLPNPGSGGRTVPPSWPAPSGFNYGATADTPWDILELEDTSNVYGYSTHGTHAGIAAGGGAGNDSGMAPAADCSPP